MKAVGLIGMITLQIQRLPLTLAASGEFRHLLLIFVKSLGPDQDQQNISPDLDRNHLSNLEKVNFKT